MRISTSITDFSPFFGNLEYLFKGLKTTGVDGVEIVIGIKSRWSVDKIKYLSQKYNLPVTSIHQPIWSGLGWYLDKDFVKIAKQLGTNKIVCHPLPRFSFNDKPMRDYLTTLAKLQNEHDLEICLENLPTQYALKLANTFFPPHHSTSDMQALYAAIDEFGLKATLDIDHLRLREPHKEAWFQKMLPKIGNIHLSSFTENQEHLPLYFGNFKSKAFIKALEAMHYKGLLTFEIYYPKLMNPFSYDFTAIKKSIEFLRLTA